MKPFRVTGRRRGYAPIAGQTGFFLVAYRKQMTITRPKGPKKQHMPGLLRLVPTQTIETA
ncbi:hypothetical protein DMY87_22600 [Rhizobium wuzhouense]|uniref:Transposase n=1 Tax=Rhizobium wuzhouense TaxID=1986026 RepID=A0ABX5NKI0_9HYPH|nr:hypothetical protein DMY87_22600 [Rhizobium wuzhouense]